ncbi:hypothetical protein IQ254_15520 [Nodosilinea sp. LEGE 07088]|uniref:LexA family protein n=1 Tax=Nodosilinea sp. LEGE 07088 TaxID=2777968 RepID=UPI00187FBD59|nr:S24 family peptidase [Nodosilinea sp. LEGE 07088]MBE9138582.1 hypothetical protein [Nodosilinea sp. LEGE 07088]
MILGSSERRVYSCLERWLTLYGYAPTIREIEADLNIASRSFIQDVLKRLQQKGYIERRRGMARAISLLRSELPLHGVVQAGYLTEHPVGYFDRVCLDGKRYPLGDYALKVCGNSMVKAEIFDGDVVVIRPSSDLWAILPGQIAVIWIDGEGGTLKHVYYREGDRQITLKSANSGHESRILDSAQVQLQGVMVGHHRRNDGLWIAM